jgi:hypothetical protein
MSSDLQGLAIEFVINLFLGELDIHDEYNVFVLLDIAGIFRNGNLLMSKCNAINVSANLETLTSYHLSLSFEELDLS